MKNEYYLTINEMIMAGTMLAQDASRMLPLE
jgi:hypothetical protein